MEENWSSGNPSMDIFIERLVYKKRERISDIFEKQMLFMLAYGGGNWRNDTMAQTRKNDGIRWSKNYTDILYERLLFKKYYLETSFNEELLLREIFCHNMIVDGY